MSAASAVGCTACRRRHRVTGDPPAVCPACGRGPLLRDDDVAFPVAELDGVGRLDARALTAGLAAWVAEVPLPEPGLDAAAMARAAKRAWWPVWLADVEARGHWTASARVDEEVESRVEELHDGRWDSRVVRRRARRSLPRVGTLDRRYDNVAVPAIDAPAALLATPEVRPHVDDDAPWLLPVADPAARDAGLAAALRDAVANELARALQVPEVQDLELRIDPPTPGWTLLLVPMWTTSWIDAAGGVHPVVVHAGTGKIGGRRKAGSGRARTALVRGLVLAGLVALAALGLALVALIVPLLAPVAVMVAMAAVVPAGHGLAVVRRVAAFNEQEATAWQP